MKSICLLPTVFCFLPSPFRLLLSAFRRLATAFEGSSSWWGPWPIPQSTTRCHCRQGKKRLVTLKSERATRECL
jgi:hypothetical protein